MVIDLTSDFQTRKQYSLLPILIAVSAIARTLGDNKDYEFSELFGGYLHVVIVSVFVSVVKYLKLG